MSFNGFTLKHYQQTFREYVAGRVLSIRQAGLQLPTPLADVPSPSAGVAAQWVCRQGYHQPHPHSSLDASTESWRKARFGGSLHLLWWLVHIKWNSSVEVAALLVIHFVLVQNWPQDNFRLCGDYFSFVPLFGCILCEYSVVSDSFRPHGL